MSLEDGKPNQCCLRIDMACPAPAGSNKGNRVTADRWAGILRNLGHRVRITGVDAPARGDLLIALHARRSFPAVHAYRKAVPGGPLIVALTGTDLYRDLPGSKAARAALDAADCLVVLQPLALARLPKKHRDKTRVIYQSALPWEGRRNNAGSEDFRVCVVGHLRAEKDPFRAAMALFQLPRASRIRVVQVGAALSPSMARRARSLMRRGSRYRWLGEVSRPTARGILAQSSLVVISSRLEGGANVISEAIADGVPILASRIPGSVGLLGTDYPGYFPVANTASLARLLTRAATEPAFYAELKDACRRLTPLIDPLRERAAWQALLAEIAPLSANDPVAV